jgi:hypothetical protein
MLGRTALGPHPPGSSRSSLERRKRRFLAYSFPSRSPDPHHLAVLTRSDFVGAACHPHRHHPDRAAPSFTALLRQDRQRRSHTPSRIHSASRRTQRQLKTDHFPACHAGVSFHAPSTSHTVLDASSYRLDTAIRPDSGEPRYVVVDADGFLHPEATAWLQFLTDVGRSPNTVRDYGRRVAW